jgi:hypothetical protein
MAFSDSNPTPSAEQVNQAHTNSDVDKSRLSQHHTLGTSATQASAGNHNHDGISSVKIKATDIDGDIPAANGLPPGGDAGQILAKDTATDYDAIWVDNYANWTSQLKHEVKLGEAISKGQAVYVSSADGTNMVVSKASNASEATSSKTMGLLESGGSTNAKVKVITEGLLSGLNTSSATAGDPVWLGTSGNLIYGLASKPVAPAHLVFIGVVTRSNSSNGEIFVKPQNGFEFNELHDVLIVAPATGEVIQRTASNLWENKTLAEAGIASTTHSGTHSDGGSDPVYIAQAQVTGLTSALSGKASTTHASTHLTGGSDEIVIDIGQVAGLTSALSGKASTTHVHGNITNAGALATSVTATNPVKVVITNSSDVVGTLSTSGASGTTFLRGDGTWSTPAGLGYVGSFQTTAASSSSAVSLAPETVSTTPANDISITGGTTTNTAGNAGEVNITGGASTTGTGLSTGGNVIIRGGATNTTQGAGGNVTINGGQGSAANGNGDISIGTTTTDNVTIGAPLTISGATSSLPITVNGQAGQYDLGISIGESTFGSSNRASIGLGSAWQLGQDQAGNGTLDFYIYGNGGTRFALGTSGLATIPGGINLSTTTAPLQVQGSAGTSGMILTSAGSGNTPTWATPGTTPVIKVAANRTTSTTGTTALTVNSGETFAITFPSGRFSVSPAVTAATNSPRYIAAVTQVTTSGFTLSVRNVSDASGTTYLYHWNAIEIVAGMGN